MKKVCTKIISGAVGLTAMLTAGISQASFMDDFKDPVDGRLDAGQWILDNAHGFLPVPLMVTDPAVGVGGGAAMLFFHESDLEKQKRLNDPESVADIPPSVTGVVGLATNNGSRLAGVFHSGNWKQDRIRYLGGLFGANFNLKYYDDADSSNANKFGIQGLFFFQDIDFRIGDSNFFIGADYINMSSRSNFGDVTGIPGVDPLALDSRDASAAIKLTYDNTDNHFNPRQGIKARIKSSVHHKALGGDFDYQDHHGFINSYHRVAPKWGVNWRVVAKSVDGDVPFYAKPFLEMRGMAALRYQADNTALGEVELTYDIDDRWTVLGFVGTGKAFNHDQSFSSAKWQTAQGAGFRYLIARQLGLRTGLDIAKGPEEWTLYIQFGGAW